MCLAVKDSPKGIYSIGEESWFFVFLSILSAGEFVSHSGGALIDENILIPVRSLPKKENSKVYKTQSS